MAVPVMAVPVMACCTVACAALVEALPAKANPVKALLHICVYIYIPFLKFIRQARRDGCGGSAPRLCRPGPKALCDMWQSELLVQ